MTRVDRLRHRYQRLLWAYPSWYRHERGLEILTTLLDAAQPGQHRPTSRDVIDVAVQGLRCRLRLPHPAYVIVAVVVAWFAAVGGAAAAGHLATALLAATPTEQEAIAIAETAMAQQPYNIAGPAYRCPELCNYGWDRHGDQVVVFDQPTFRNNGLDHTMVVYWPQGRDHAAAVEVARVRLVGDGWTINTDAHVPQPIGAGRILGFVADKGNLSLRLSTEPVPESGDGYPGPVPDDFPISLTFERHPPPVPLAATVMAAAAASVFSSWMILVWALHRYRRHAAGRKAMIVLLGSPPLMVISMVDCLTVPFTVLPVLNSIPFGLIPAATVSYLALFSLIPGVATIVGAAAIVAVLAIAAAALPTRGLPSQYRAPAA